MSEKTLPIDVLGDWYEVPIQVQLHIIALRERLVELERAAAEPVAYQYAHPYFGGGKIWREEQRWNGHTSDEARALYAALPTPDAEIREPVEVDDEIARKLWREWFDAGCMTGLDTARFWLRVWQRELGPTLGLVELREPTPEECTDMTKWFKVECEACCINPQETVDYGRAIFDAVKIVMFPQESEVGL